MVVDLGFFWVYLRLLLPLDCFSGSLYLRGGCRCGYNDALLTTAARARLRSYSLLIDSAALM